MVKQLSLFDLGSNYNNQVKSFYENILKSGFNYQEIDIGDITFKAGQLESIHRWYRLTPSYSPGLVRFLLKELKVTQNDLILDPFSGRGTTIIECQKKGINAVGIEINPLLQNVGKKSLIWEINNFNLIDIYLKEIHQLIENYKNYSLEQILELFQTRLPIIHNVFRWWKLPILKNLIICRETMIKKEYFSIYNYLWLALNKACLDCANIHRNHPTITFDDNHQRQIDVYSEIRNNLNIIRHDLENLTKTELKFSQLNAVILGDSTNHLKEKVGYVDFVITSPPYPNRYSYVHQTRPQLHFMEILENIRQATEIDLKAIGGTWGRATSILQKDLIEVPEEIIPYLSYYTELKEQNVLMCNYATKYFLDLWRHIKSLKEITSNKFKGVYIVGNSRLANVEIFTEVILSKLFQHEGFEVEKIVFFRKRGGKKRLYETAIWIRN